MTANKPQEADLTAKEKALELRKRLKSKKPDFVRQESWRYKRLKENWRRPKGLDNKMRRKIKGWPKSPEIGYRGPKLVRGLHPSGLEEILVYNVEDLAKVDPKTQAVRIAHTVGARKRMEIIAKARAEDIRILNPKEIEAEIEEEKERVEAEEVKETEEAKEEAEKTVKKRKTASKKRKRKTRRKGE